MFCSDDRHPNDLAKEHIDGHVKRAIAKGFDLFDVLRIACLNPIEHYGLEVGRLQPGDPADFIVVEDLKTFKNIQTVIDGKIVSDEGGPCIDSPLSTAPNNFHTGYIREEDLSIQSCAHSEVIQVIDHELITYEEIIDFPSGHHGILKIAVVNRYENAPPAVAYIDGFGLKRGAIASSVAHDSHNIIAVGCSDELIVKAVNRIIDHCGGICAVDEEEEWTVPLPIAGLMSDGDGFDVADRYAMIGRIVKERFGSTLDAPFMTLSFMALLVIPELKLSDKGLFDGRSFHFIDSCRSG
jgi:adenine deaminase